MSVETNPHNYTNMNNTFSQFFMPAPNSPKEICGANGKFLPKPLLFHLRHPNSEKSQPKFWQILSPKNSFAKTSSALNSASFSLKGETRPSPHHRHTENQKGNRGKTKLECVVVSEGGRDTAEAEGQPSGLSWSGGCGVAEFISERTI